MSLPWRGQAGPTPLREGSQMPSEEESRAVLAFNPKRRPGPPPESPPAQGTQSPAGGASDSELQRIYDTHAVQIYRFIYHKVGNREDAEDLTAHVFMKAAQSLDPQQDAPRQIAWLYQVARTTIADYWRGYFKRSGVCLGGLGEEIGEPEG